MAGFGACDAEWFRRHLRPSGAALPVAAIPSRPGTDALVAQAEGALRHPWPVPRVHDLLRFHRDGDREAYEAVIWERHIRLARAVVAACVDLSTEFLDDVVEGVWSWCEQSTWCWPAHDDARFRGEQLPDVDLAFLDLGAGEVAAQLAWTWHLLGDRLEERAPGLRRRVLREVRRRVLEPFAERQDWHWLGLDGHVHNWLPWIAGNVLVAALALEEDRARRAAAVAGVDVCLARFADALPPDGAIDEGFGYWWNGACRALEACELLDFATDGAYRQWREHPSLRATVGFPAAMHLGGDWFVNVADGTAKAAPGVPWETLFRLGVSLGDDAAVALAASQQTPGAASVTPQYLGRLVRELADDDWWSAGAPVDAAATGDAWFDSVQVLVARATDARVTLVAKGGHNDENHNHNDVGSFIVALDGVPVVVDLGRPTYTAQTFGPERYSIWTMTSHWHNVPVVAGTGQSPGRAFTARDVTVVSESDRAELRLDLAGAYPTDALTNWLRTVRLNRATGTVEVADAWGFRDEPGVPSELRLVVAGEVEQLAPGDVRVRPVEGRRRLRVHSDLPIVVERRDLSDDMLTAVWGEYVHLLKIALNNDKNGHAVVQCIPEEGEPA